jgi:predicted membrane metal-binding protein
MAEKLAEKPSLGTFSRTFRKHWFAAMSGGASVPFTALAVFLDNRWVQLLFACLALTGTWFAAYRVWQPERQKVCDLEARLTAKINMDDGSVRQYPTQQTMPPPLPPEEGPLCKWVQITRMA